MIQKIKVIAFDADDTLWINETYYQETEKKFCSLLEGFMNSEKISAELLKTEIQNMDLYGFGAKAFVLSLIETALRISNNTVNPNVIYDIILLGKELINKPVVLLGEIESVLSKLKPRYHLVLATKGDLLDQERKLEKSGLSDFFDHIEIMSDKQESDYQVLLKKQNITPEEFLMVGNSVKSDILPVVSLGASAVHIPYHTTWQHEVIEQEDLKLNYYELSKIEDLPDLLQLT